MILETERLILRPWEESDACDLFEYAKDPRVGPIAGWPVHNSVEDSREIIKNVLSVPETYAVILKENNKAVGSIGLIFNHSHTDVKISKNEAEIGYWIGVPYWGRGLIPEAVREIIRHSFEDLNLDGLWCGYYDGNIQSKRVMEKCGFVYHHTEKDKPCELMGDVRTSHFTYLKKSEIHS
ncbi:MAG: GNAT family N-acetyltransferase [Acutalibacteraceae bacterium]